MKNIFSPIRASWWVLDSFRPPEPKYVSFLLSRHDVRRVHENFFLADTSELLAVLPISASWAQKRLICTSNSWENFFSPTRANRSVLDTFRSPEPKNVWFLLSRHDVRRVHEKFSSRRFGRAVGCFTHFGLLSPKTFDSYFIDIMYVEFMKNFFLADTSELSLFYPIRPPEPKNVWFLLYRHHKRRIHEKIFSGRFERTDGC